ncbi:MAG TPA: phosphoribosylformylglycinamidine cyclo-ligase [Candidatus Dormibacteraeota bacterium]
MTRAYVAAGVDVDAYERMLERVKPLIAGTQDAQVVTGVGPFAGLYRMPGGGLLAASADGVGTKIKVAVAAGRHRGIGLDLVNHCVNDIATAGARPLFFLDYFAAGQLEAEVFTAVMEGLAEACRLNGCALLGGETAEMPGVYDLGDYDLAGFVVGLVEDAAPRPPVRAGDLLIGLPSSGLHTNGFSLVRRVFQGVPLEQEFPELGRPLGDELLEPHRSYLKELQELEWKAAAHITGGGLTGNLPRVLPEGLCFRLDTGAWRVPPIFDLIQRRGRISDREMMATFNQGIGMVLVSEEPLAGYPVIGEVVAA